MKPRLMFFMWALLIASTESLFAQSPPAAIYVESFRQGSARVAPDKFEVKLSSHDANYSQQVKDAQGNARYFFSVTPLGPEGDTEITAWRVNLSDLQRPRYSNILLPAAQAPDRPNGAARNAPGLLDPSRFSPVPISARRIIKVDGFYLVLRVASYHFTPPDSPYLDSMAVEVEFTNSDPRIVDGASDKGR